MTSPTNQPAPLSKPVMAWAAYDKNGQLLGLLWNEACPDKDSRENWVQVEVRPMQSAPAVSEEAKWESETATSSDDGGNFFQETVDRAKKIIEEKDKEIERLRIEVKTYRDLWQGKNYREEFKKLSIELHEANRLYEFYKGLSEELEQKIEKAREALKQWYYLWDKNFIGWDNGEPLSKVTAESFSKLLDITREALSSLSSPAEQEKKDEEPSASECLEWLAKSKAWLCEWNGNWLIKSTNGKTPLEAIRRAMKEERKSNE